HGPPAWRRGQEPGRGGAPARSHRHAPARGAAPALGPTGGPRRAGRGGGPRRGAAGKSLGVVALLRDLPATRQLEEQLRRSDRLAALGTLAAGLAHEIQNPLTSLLTVSAPLSR